MFAGALLIGALAVLAGCSSAKPLFDGSSLQGWQVLGDADWEYLVNDEWFASLDAHPGFLDIVRRMRAAAEGP